MALLGSSFCATHVAPGQLQSRRSSGILTRNTDSLKCRAPRRHSARCESVAPGQRDMKAASASSPMGTVVMTDETVPEGHQGLHGFLYGEGGADVHDPSADEYKVRSGEDEGQVLLQVPAFLESRQQHRIAGVYAVFDSANVLQYVGYSRNMVLSIKAHSAHPVTGAVTTGVRVRVFRDPALLTRARLDQERLQWIEVLQEGEGVPQGNSPEGLLTWEGREGPSASSASAVMSEQERSEYEEKKLKMRKAMGENLHDDVEGETETAKERRMKLLKAVEGDNWSGVIGDQTAQTRPQTETSDQTPTPLVESTPAPAPSAPSAPSRPQPVTSPFAAGQSGAGKGVSAQAEEEVEEFLAMTVANVDSVLEEVRPYLISDGGNVEVVAVKGGVVELRLQGACGTCPSATTTMKMGIERVLKEKFGHALEEVKEVGGALEAAIPTVKSVDSLLDMLRPAIKNFNGSVEVLSVDAGAGTCQVKYSGPPPIFQGIQAAIKDKFPSLATITNVQ